MTTEELLTPRWEVIADYPQSLFFINEIVYYDGFWAKTKEVKVGVNPQNYPAIFKKLNWWEKRNEEELPDYVQIKCEAFKKIVKVNKYLIYKNNIYGLRYYNNNYECSIVIKMCLPSTEKEYDKQTTGTTTD